MPPPICENHPGQSREALESGVTDGARTRNNQNHNLGLYL